MADSGSCLAARHASSNQIVADLWRALFGGAYAGGNQVPMSHHSVCLVAPSFLVLPGCGAV
jgi:hypothetical protein